MKAALEADRRATLADVQSRGDGLAVARGIADRVDGLLRRTLMGVAENRQIAVDDLWRVTSPLALGSYARRDLGPYSDVDVMFLIDDPESERTRDWLDGVLYGLWDQGFELSHSVRTVDQAMAAAEDDPRVLSTLIEHRRVAPDGPERHPVLDAALQSHFASPSRVDGFIRAKLAESKARAARYGDTVFLLEPHVKEGDGGLRELHTMRWLAWARWRTSTLQGLLTKGVISENEVRTIRKAYGFLLMVRAHMHVKSKRRQDVLRFDLQEEIAPSMGFWPRPTAKDPRRAATERFMRAYYFHARQLKVHCRAVIDRAASPTRASGAALPAPGGFRVWNGALTTSHKEQFEHNPASMLRIFRVAQEEALQIYSYTQNRIRESVHLIDRDVRRRPDVVREFFRLLEDPKVDGSMLELMHDLGVLKALIPEFNRVTSRWQHSLYHVYTVDVHSLVVLKNLKRLRRGDFKTEVADLTRWMSGLMRPNVVYLAGLLHDVGKGWDRGDHSERGEKVARSVGARFEAAKLLEWTRRETEDLAWLVRQHLLMSDISQRRDLSDLQLIQTFADECRTVERLRMLYILTFADMKGTSPKVWTTWKAGLLEQLYAHAIRVLTSSDDQEPETQLRLRRITLTDELEAEARERPELSIDVESLHAFVSAMPGRYVLAFTPRRMVRHAQMWMDVSRFGGLAVHVTHLRREGTTRVNVICPDRPGLLALLAGTLAANRLQILSAQIYSVSRGDFSQASNEFPAEMSGTYDLIGTALERREEELALDVLHVVDQDGELCDDPQRWQRFREDLESVVFQGVDVAKLHAERNPPSRLDTRVRPEVPVEIRFNNTDSDSETVIEVFGPDHLGALYRVAKAISDAGLVIALAKISTQGDRVADGFYVHDGQGKKVTDPAQQERVRDALKSALLDYEGPRRSLAQIV